MEAWTTEDVANLLSLMGSLCEFAAALREVVTLVVFWQIIAIGRDLWDDFNRKKTFNLDLPGRSR